MEQVEGGDLIVNRGHESRPKEGSATDGRNLNTVEGYVAALKLAQASSIFPLKTSLQTGVNLKLPLSRQTSKMLSRIM